MPPVLPVYSPYDARSHWKEPFEMTYLPVPGELVPRNHAETVSFWGSRLVESGIWTMSLPSKRSADPKKTPGIHDGSWLSAPGELPSVPLLPCPDQSRTT